MSIAGISHLCFLPSIASHLVSGCSQLTCKINTAWGYTLMSHCIGTSFFTWLSGRRYMQPCLITTYLNMSTSKILTKFSMIWTAHNIHWLSLLSNLENHMHMKHLVPAEAIFTPPHDSLPLILNFGNLSCAKFKLPENITHIMMSNVSFCHWEYPSSTHTQAKLSWPYPDLPGQL